MTTIQQAVALSLLSDCYDRIAQWQRTYNRPMPQACYTRQLARFLEAKIERAYLEPVA